jgi:hypothetical protein
MQRDLKSSSLRRRIAVGSRALGLSGLLLLAAFHPIRAAAQSCHTPSLRPTDGLTYRAAIIGSFASFDNAAGRGEYQGLAAQLTLAHPWFVADVVLPAYRVAQVGSHSYGLGDLVLSARVNAYQQISSGMHTSGWTLLAGPELAATLPTGDADHMLGMGHVMIMPGAFLQLQQGGWSILAQVAYGRAIADSSEHHHDMPMPLVNPMNRSELTHAIGVSAALHPNLRATARLFGAANVFDHRGTAREIVAPGLQLIAGAFDLALEVQVPLLGDPFESRTLISAGAQW